MGAGIAAEPAESGAAGDTNAQPMDGELLGRVLERDNLRRALKQVRRNKGAPGIDGMSVDELPKHLVHHWEAIKADIQAGRYRPQPVRRVEIPKPDGRKRMLGIPTVLDRFVQQAIAQIVQAQWEPHFHPDSYGFRLQRSATQAVRKLQTDVKDGRAAAWRALNNALPEATAGRELKFLFLPDGEDPDSLVGKEGKEAFEARLAGALPLSEYLVQHLAGAIDISHADGKARFVAEARPLLERMPEGPYRELLLDRLAEAIGVSAERFLKIVGPMTTPASSIPAPAQAPPRSPRTARSTGRGSLVRQAVQTLLHFPGTVARIPATEIEALGSLDEPAQEPDRPGQPECCGPGGGRGFSGGDRWE